MKYLRTADVARAAGVHPNTVRRYVEWGLLPPVVREANGYRRFTQHHLDCMQIASLIFMAAYPGKAFRQSGNRVLQAAVDGEWDEALRRAHDHLGMVRAERARAETAAALLEHWAESVPNHAAGPRLQIGPAARLLGASVDMLRNWERNGLLTVPRHATNGYRLYGPAEIDRLRVIRTLSLAGYSQMAILRMVLQLDRGLTAGLRHALDTPTPGEDVYTAADRWLTTLADQEQLALKLIALVEGVLRRA